MLNVVPKTLSTERGIVIQKNLPALKKDVGDFNHFGDWSPWSDLDPAYRVSVEGLPLTVGHKFNWSSDSADVGSGHQAITAISENQIDLTLIFTAPWESEANVYYKLEKVNGGTKVSWGFEQEANLMMGFFGIEEMVGESYDKGLAKLKTLAESKLFLNAPVLK